MQPCAYDIFNKNLKWVGLPIFFFFGKINLSMLYLINSWILKNVE